MRVLVLHNSYNVAGGEEVAVEQEIRMLRDQGNQVALYAVSNPAIHPRPLLEQLALARTALWSKDSYYKVFEMCRDFEPDIAHVHNFWMTLTPSVHKACHDAGVPTVQTLHNYRLVCLNAVMLRNGRMCQDCVGALPWRGVVRRCYRGSASGSATVAGMVTYHRIRDTWAQDVDAFIAPSSYAASLLAAGRVPPDRTIVKPNRTQSNKRPGKFE